MLEDIVRDPAIYEEIESSGFAVIIRKFEAYLRTRGYASTTIWFYEQATVHFALWAARKKLVASEITPGLVKIFISRHLGKCRCPLGGVRQVKMVRPALRHFEVVLDSGGYRAPHQEVESTAVDHEIQRFDDHLRTTCGLREATRKYRRRYVREFLHKSFGAGEMKVAELGQQDVIRYVANRTSGFKPGSTQVVASSLRSYFRFLQLRGECDETLRLAVPSSPNWKLAGLPKVLADEEVSRLLTAFDRSTATGRRDYAIARCLTQLGLRAGEIVRLRLDDIDWRKASLRIAGGKSRRDDELPLPASVGSAIAAYLRRGRPQTSTRCVFLRDRPPVGEGITRHIVQNVIVRAARRANLDTIVTGTQILRHTAATRMLRHGASMKEVADVLRHRCLDTTAIYAKVDLQQLAVVALPWPEDLS